MKKLITFTAAALFGSTIPAGAAPLGSEFQMNSFTTSDQASVAMGAIGTNGFVVTWNSQGQDGGSYGVFGRRSSSTGAFVGSEFQINSNTIDNQFDSAVGPDGSNGFVVAWSSFSQDGEVNGIFAQRFASDGSAAGSEFQVNSYTTDHQQKVVVGADGAGGFVLAWESADQDGDSRGIFAQRFASDGLANGSEFQVNSFTTSNQSDPQLGSLDAGFVVGWISQDADETGIFARCYSSAGAPIGSEFQVNTYTTDAQYFPGIGPDGRDGFVMAWASGGNHDGDRYGVFAQRFSDSCMPLGTEFQVNSYTTEYQFDPVIAADGIGGFVIAWDNYEEDGSGYGIFAQRFTSGGSPLGSEFQVNSYTTGFQYNPAISNDGAGGYVVAWYSEFQDGDGRGIFAQRFEGTPACPSVPELGCKQATKGKLILKDNGDDSKDKLIWKFGKGPLITQGNFGEPTTANSYIFCLYDNNSNVIDLTIPAGAPWEAVSDKGYQYKNPVGSNDSVTKVKLLGGAAGKSKLQLKGKGAGLAMPMPGVTLLSGPAIVAQMHGNGDCWETSFDAMQSTHKVNSYKGKF